MVGLVSRCMLNAPDTANDTETTGVCNGSRKLGASRDVHAREHDGVVDLQEIGGDGADLFC